MWEVVVLSEQGPRKKNKKRGGEKKKKVNYFPAYFTGVGNNKASLSHLLP